MEMRMRSMLDRKNSDSRSIDVLYHCIVNVNVWLHLRSSQAAPHTCWNLSKSLAKAEAGMPMPVSLTSNRTVNGLLLAAGCGTRGKWLLAWAVYNLKCVETEIAKGGEGGEGGGEGGLGPSKDCCE